MNYSREEVARMCRVWGGTLWLPPGIDGPKLLWALSGCESSFGEDCTPRHEPEYDVGGVYSTAPVQAKLLEQFGRAGACSYGPWQIMLCNCQPGVSPDAMASLERCGLETVTFINRRILTAQKATTVAEIAESYNAGRWQWSKVPAGVRRYAVDCVKYYESEPMPGVPA